MMKRLKQFFCWHIWRDYEEAKREKQPAVFEMCVKCDLIRVKRN